ncbi:hypothetical protein SAM23877_4055 [Streptomyces ambofaciens ATCC 23877]|uniref:Uncharacterized protein n=1 Tax=Streptomyces ambofaciens (strain ATCC 23877 / 3486 / DSM 40053 / JCM 4204 / NBRC 12836 / NRRL B-2516) TaxID=278992 RepID=A0A0K2AVF5_STRA7|nr:hypothetical protein SAM23877_4055 [Streptomyces ambofaciens ATCC 23877]
MPSAGRSSLGGLCVDITAHRRSGRDSRGCWRGRAPGSDCVSGGVVNIATPQSRKSSPIRRNLSRQKGREKWGSVAGGSKTVRHDPLLTK